MASDSGTAATGTNLWAITEEEPTLPIAVSIPLRFLELSYYAPPKISSRLIYLADPDTATKYPDFVPDLVLLSLKKWVPLDVREYYSFAGDHRKYWVYYSSYPEAEWLISKLAQDGKKIELRFQNGPDLLFHVSEGRSVGLDLK